MSNDDWGYDEWKLANPYDHASPLEEANAEIRSLQDENDSLLNALDEMLATLKAAAELLDGSPFHNGAVHKEIRAVLAKVEKTNA